MRRAFAFLVLTAIAAASLFAAPPPAASYTGAFSQDSDLREFFFTVSGPEPVTVTLRTYSYAGGTNGAGTAIPAGGFDPTISVFDANGNLVALNRDGGCDNVAADPVTSFCWDSFLRVPLPAGNYTAILTESENLPNGPTLADSFVYAGEGNFTSIPGIGTNGFLDFFRSQRTHAYALDISGASASPQTTITSSATLPNGINGQNYQFAFTATSGSGANLTWSLAPGSLMPPGLILHPNGTVTGEPSSGGSYGFTVQVTDGTQPVTQAVTVTIFNPLAITNSSLPSGTVNQIYGPVSFGLTGGSGSSNWSATGLPAGLGISASGQISGTPTAGGTFTVQVTVIDPVSNLSTSANIQLTVNYAPLQITSAGALGGFAPGANIAATPSATGGKTPYAWSATGLPAGFNFNSATGAFSGVSSAAGSYSLTLTVSDAQSPAATASLTVTFSVLGITTSSLPQGSTDSNYSQTFTATGGTPPYTWSGSGPAGLTLSSAGALSGKPNATGTFAFSVQVSDSKSVTTSSSFSLTVTGPSSPLKVPGGSLSDATVSSLYDSAVSATGGSPPYTWSLVGGALPDGGVTLNSSGGIHGTPKTPGTYTFTAQATDSLGANASGTFTLTVDPAPLVLSSVSSFPKGIDGSQYPAQILSATGGVKPYTFTITGSLPPGLSFSTPEISGIPTTSGTYPFTVTVTDSAAKQVVANASIVISPEHADLIISQSSISFSLTAGSAGVPTPASVPVRSSDVQQLLNFSVTATPAVAWLDVSGGGTTPGSVGLVLDASALSLAASATPYQTAINVTCLAPSSCAGNTQTIAVSLTVSDPAAQLSADTNLLSFFASTSSPAASSQPLGIQNTGGGTLLIDSVIAADSWLTVTGAPASLRAGPAAILTVTANPAGLNAGYYQSSITINSPAGSISVPVTLNLTANALMTLSSSGMQFHAPAGNAPGSTAGSFTVGLAGASSANWTAAVMPGTNWLSVSTPSGTTTPSTPSTAAFALDPTVIAGLQPQTYYGQVQVASGTVTDSPLSFVVVLNIESPTTPPKPELSTGGVTLTTSAGSGKSSAPAIQVFASSSMPIAYQASVNTADGSGWLSVSPTTGFASSSAPGTSVVSVDNTGLAAGVYHGGVSYAYSGDAVRTLNVTLIVTSGGGQSPSLTSATRSDSAAVTAKATCAATKLVPTQVGLVDNFAQPAGWPTPIAISVQNDCGGAMPNAQVVAKFSNGDPPLVLSPADTISGKFVGTWTPSALSSQITVTGLATAAGFQPASIKITGQVTPNSPPILSPHGTVHIFTTGVGAALAPGEIVAIYGSNLAAGILSASTVPLPTSLGGTTVLIGGRQAPLYFVSPGQINAQVPFELPAGNGYQILVNANGSLSTPDSLHLEVASPEIASFFTTGKIIAQHSADYTLVTEDSPAVPGETLIFYLAGMGATDTPVASGAASPSNPLAHPLALPTLTLNGSAILTSFAGLTPTAVGLYQIDFVVPAGTPSGDLQLVVSQAGVPTNMTILPVKAPKQ